MQGDLSKTTNMLVAACRYEDVDKGNLVDTSTTWFDLGGVAQLLTVVSTLRALQVCKCYTACLGCMACTAAEGRVKPAGL